MKYILFLLIGFSLSASGQTETFKIFEKRVAPFWIYYKKVIADDLPKPLYIVGVQFTDARYKYLTEIGSVVFGSSDDFEEFVSLLSESFAVIEDKDRQISWDGTGNEKYSVSKIEGKKQVSIESKKGAYIDIKKWQLENLIKALKRINFGSEVVKE